MKRQVKVDMGELDTALNWGTSEWNYYLDLETGKVIGIDDETSRMLGELIEDMYDMHDSTGVFVHNTDFAGVRRMLDRVNRKTYRVEIFHVPSEGSIALITKK